MLHWPRLVIDRLDIDHFDSERAIGCLLGAAVARVRVGQQAEIGNSSSSSNSNANASELAVCRLVDGSQQIMLNQFVSYQIDLYLSLILSNIHINKSIQIEFTAFVCIANT